MYYLLLSSIFVFILLCTILFLFSFVFHDYFLFVGEDILDSAVYSRGGENTNGYTNGDNVDGQRGRADVSSPIMPEYGARTLGKNFLVELTKAAIEYRLLDLVITPFI